MYNIAYVTLKLGVVMGVTSVITNKDLVSIRMSCNHLSEQFCLNDTAMDNCACDDECAEYGDCCPDVGHYKLEDQTLPARYECVRFEGSSSRRLEAGTYMKGQCPLEWEDEEMARLCHSEGSSAAYTSSSSDPMAHLPVTSNITSITYINYYCAICNNDTTNITFWEQDIVCPSLLNSIQDHIASNLVFINSSWGAVLPSESETEFHHCHIKIVNNHHTRACVPVINTCANDWTNATVEDLCHSYTALRYVRDSATGIELGYRNPHCILCNHIPFEEISCSLMSQNKSHSVPLKEKVIFNGKTIINVVSSGCQLGEVRDPFFNKCRNVVCSSENKQNNSSECALQNLTSVNSSNATFLLHSTPSIKFLSESSRCHKIFLPRENYTVLENGELFFKTHNQSYKVDDYELSEEGVRVCVSQTSDTNRADIWDLASNMIYSELEDMKMTCPDSKGFCNYTNFGGLCQCDVLCAEYGDCCPDAIYYNLEDQTLPERYECVSLGDDTSSRRLEGGTFMKSRCMPEWEDEETAWLCQVGGSPAANISVSSDPMAHLPVTSNFSSVTYINYYCAICNKDTTNIIFWEIELVCPEFWVLLGDYVINNLVYDEGKWGVFGPLRHLEKFNQCRIEIIMPDTSTRTCHRSIYHCAENWTDTKVEALCHSYTATRYVYEEDASQWLAYRNPHCAYCNFRSAQEVHCGVESLPVTAEPSPFRVVIDITDKSNNNPTSQCLPGQAFDPYLRLCRNVLFRNNVSNAIDSDIGLKPTDSSADNQSARSVHLSSEDIIETYDTEFSGNENYTTVELVYEDVINLSDSENTTAESYNLTANPCGKLYCLSTLLYPEEFKILENGSLCVPLMNESDIIIIIILQNGSLCIPRMNESVIINNDTFLMVKDGLCICHSDNADPSSSARKYSALMGWVTFVGLAISSVCLLLYLITFLLVPDLSNLPGKSRASLCLSLLVAYLLFMFLHLVETATTQCYIIAAALYYFFMAYFCWINIMSFDVWYTFRQYRNTFAQSSRQKQMRFMAYSSYGWLTPAVAVVLVVSLDKAAPAGFPEEFLPNLGQHICWFGNRKALLVFFVAPMTAILILNFVFFIYTTCIISRTRATTQRITSMCHQEKQLKMYVRLAVLMGLTWITAIVAGSLEIEWIWYIFVLLNTLQGAFIFLAFTCRRKVWNSLRDLCRKIPCSTKRDDSTYLGKCDQKIDSATVTTNVEFSETESTNF